MNTKTVAHRNRTKASASLIFLMLFGMAEVQAQESGLKQTEQAQACLETEVKGMACIPAGEFIRGSEAKRSCQQGEVKRIPADQPNHRPVATLEMPTYYIDLTEVTYSAYQACVKAKACPKRRPAYGDFNAPKQPMTGLSWYEAFTYCKAMGKHLPTEAEWEKAARGTEGELYPWGNEEPDCKRAVIKDKTGRSCGVKKRKTYPDKGKVLLVGSRPAARYGLFDMIGNAEEWTADWYSSDWEKCGANCAGFDPKGPCPNQSSEQACPGHNKKVVRGGSWYWPKNCATSWTRRPHFPSNKPYHHFGFRCAASLEQAKALIQQVKSL